MPRMREKDDAATGAGRRVTMATVGRMAGVSQVTVSRALSDPSKVSPETLRRIREAIEVTGFVPNAIAGALASSRSKLVTALVPSLTNIVYSSFVTTFSDRMRARGYQILLSETGFDPAEEEALISTHLSRRPDAMLLTGIHHSAMARRLLLGAGIPVVEVWDLSDSPIDLCVGFNHAEAGRAVADFAREFGHDTAATVTASDERAHRRQRTFSERFAARGGRRVEDVDVGGPASIGAGRRALAALLDRPSPSCSVVFCSSDLLAHGVMIEARSRGMDIPGDLALIGFGDQDFAQDLDPALTSVRVDRTRLGKDAAGALLARLEHAGAAGPVIDLGFEIVHRAST
ncbi:LacI family DNA-binding transcriptional regulator [Roseivivax sediminis]|uniref:Transcriptional regulator, LacI family n=1 Tax=Roseivivax sediminis TaxID=936889 RepID=A0A1I2DWF4_9RHOB|nr:LacI family DNA-binding transcriptional regulator [Roseivivax sediminis]SFE84807.1 transcriptional regulator, LacI family [Roseivivax sediminis]